MSNITSALQRHRKKEKIPQICNRHHGQIDGNIIQPFAINTKQQKFLKKTSRLTKTKAFLQDERRHLSSATLSTKKMTSSPTKIGRCHWAARIHRPKRGEIVQLSHCPGHRCNTSKRYSKVIICKKNSGEETFTHKAFATKNSKVTIALRRHRQKRSKLLFSGSAPERILVET